LAVAYDALGRLPEAGWHRERAIEIEPYSAAAWNELEDSPDWSSDSASQRPVLTRAALARIHVRGGLYPQAIAYLRSATSSGAGRPDLQTLLAEALWREGRRIDAVEQCRGLLTLLPNSVKANSIMAESLLASDQVDEAQAYLARVQAALLLERKDLPGDSLPALAFAARGAFRLDEQVMVQALDWKHAPASRPESAESNWIVRLGLSEEAPSVESGALLSDEPGWLPAFQIVGAQAYQEQPDDARIGAPVAVEAGLVGAVADKASADDHQPGTIAEEPDMSGNEGSAESRAEGSAEQEPDELKATLAWLEALAARQGLSLDELSSGEEPVNAAEEYPDWLTRDMSDIPGGAELAAPAAEAGSSDDVPPWLRDSVDTPNVAAPPLAESDSLDDLGWLDQIAAGAGEPIDEPPTLSWQKRGPGDADDEDALSWLDGVIESHPAAAAAGLAAMSAADVGEQSPSEETEAESADYDVAAMEPPGAMIEVHSEESSGIDTLSTETMIEAAIPEKEEAEAAMMTSLDDVPDDLEAAQVLLGAAIVAGRSPSEEGEEPLAVIAAQSVTELADDVPEDPAEVLTWLERLAAQQIAERAVPAPAEPFQVVEEPVTPAVPLEIVAAAAAAEAFAGRDIGEDVAADDEVDSVENLIASIPDDPDAAMAWLEQLAARQEAALDETQVVEEDVAAAIAAEAAPEPEPESPESAEDGTEAADDRPVLAAAALLAVAEPSEEAEAIWPVDVEKEVTESMPDWLELEPAQPPGGLSEDLPTAWEADQADFAAWLSGEDAARVTEPVRAAGYSGEDTMPSTGFDDMGVVVGPDRATLIAGYEQDLSRGENVEGVLLGLKALLADSAEPDPVTTRLLGDAYAQAGDYTRALEAYGSALDML